MEVPMKVDALIHSDPAILCGKPVVRGTRLSVEFLLELVGLGWTDERILDEYPHLIPDPEKESGYRGTESDRGSEQKHHRHSSV
jgi:uncharacterized protein (DUF433 family)